MFKPSFYDKKIVKKPWGYEYVCFRNKKKISLTFLNINYKKKTSLHCHPKKKTGFILLEGKAKIQLGLWESTSKIYKPPSKLMIRTGLFHSIQSLSKSGLKAIEFETPVLKNDLVRYQDSYGRRTKPYEGRGFLKSLKKNDIIFKKPSIENPQNFRFGRVTLSLQVHKNFKKILKNKISTIFGVLGGQVVDKKGRNILSEGDIIKLGTFKKLSKYFKIKKNLILIVVS
jgi:mannose-6-phosphate isomerase-like protein (cupin superfamily)